jgi:anti-sigma factor RsiW
VAADGCARWLDEAVAFALDDLDGEVRARMVAHLDACPACRREVASLAATLDRMTAATGPVPPSREFVARVLTAAGATEETPAPVGRPSRRRPTIRRRPATRRVVIGAAAAVAVAASLTAWVVFPGHRAGRSPSVMFPMRTATGQTVGRAVISDRRPATVMVSFQVEPDYAASPDGRYQILALPRSGTPIDLGAVAVTAGRGGLEAQTALAVRDIAGVEVVGSDGRDLCKGGIAPPPP